LTPSRSLQAAFLLSGVAGLVYEVLWSRYLGLFVGHGAYAQILVLAVYLGGMAIGSFAIAERSRRLVQPLLWYAGAEGVLALFGIAFHWLFLIVTELGYEVLFPAAGSAGAVGALRWGLAGLLILPQAIVLGTTFPLMAAGLVRADRDHPGGAVAAAYLLNTFGGALGVLLAGFVFIGAFGLPGTSLAAAALNLTAAGLVWRRVRAGTEGAGAIAPAGRDPNTSERHEVPRPADDHASTAVPAVPSERSLATILLSVAFGTAVASFAYEIGWIRMLSLVLGSATHSFELMLSAFVLGIALGALLIRRRSDASEDRVLLLGGIQVLMGLTALLSLLVYLGMFEAMAGLVRTFGGQANGYVWFNAGRYGLALLLMLPSTVLAGMTLPVLTAALLAAGIGERTIGQVYGVNTMGSVFGAAVAGLVALPALGLEGLIVAGAALDVVLGLWLLERAGRWRGYGRGPVLAATGASILLFVGVPGLVSFDPTMLASGVYRRGVLEGERWESLFYRDGRTATVSAHIGTTDGVIVLATNGKPDASLGPRWVLAGRDTLPEEPIPRGRDFATQVLAPIVGLAHRPDARAAANIGHGSGMTASSLLTSESLERVVTIEIEPLMVEGSLVFMPANRLALTDPRASYVFDDAKSYFAYRRERFDLIVAEPSNPWVSGIASLYTREFYERATTYMSEGAVFVQWTQLYELNDDLFLSILAALDAVFPYYRAYLVGDSDVAIVASLEPLPDPDWSVLQSEGFRTLTTGAPSFLPQHLEAGFLFDAETMRPLLERRPVPANSDFHPLLDLGADRARFEQQVAYGIYGFAVERVDLQRYLTGAPRAPRPYATPPALGLAGAVLTERGAWLRGAMEAGGGIAPDEFPEWQEELVHLQTFLGSGGGARIDRWDAWSSGFVRAESALHWGTTEWVDTTFYRSVYALLDRGEAPPEARATVEMMHAYALGDWPTVAASADVLVAPVAARGSWVPPDLLLDVAVLAYLETGRPDAAATALDALGPLTPRQPGNVRDRLLRALVAEALETSAR
jgi:hypothetical protein